MQKSRTYLVDPYAKETLYVMYEKDFERPITNVGEDMLIKMGISINTTIKRIEGMEELGLVEEKEAFGRRMVRITDKGRRIVEKLKEIDKIMEE